MAMKLQRIQEEIKKMYEDERTEVLGKELYDKCVERLEPIPKFSCDMYKDERTEALGIEQRNSEKLKELIDMRGELLKSIPKFWLRAFTSHPILVSRLNSKDREIFEYLSSIEVEDNQDAKSGYSITFNFDDNPYFDNPSLAKSLTFHEGKLKEVKATTIQWKEGKSMPNVDPPKWNDGLVHDQTRDWSFFVWFHSRKEKNEMRNRPDQLADLIKNKFWIDPFKYLYKSDYQVDGDDEKENK